MALSAAAIESNLRRIEVTIRPENSSGDPQESNLRRIAVAVFPSIPFSAAPIESNLRRVAVSVQVPPSPGGDSSFGLTGGNDILFLNPMWKPDEIMSPIRFH